MTAPSTPHGGRLPKGRTQSGRERQRPEEQRGRRTHEPEEINARVLEVCSHYTGSPGTTVGRRTTWACPACGKRKLEALPERGMAGCWNSGCGVPQTTDALGLVAFFENLDRRLEFPILLARASELVGTNAPETRSTRGGVGKHRVFRGAPSASKPPADPDLIDAVYTGLLALCPLGGRDRAFWASRGVHPESVQSGRFASATRPRIMAAILHLEREFGRGGLLSVPGFFENARANVSFTLIGDYQLIPYLDRQGRVATIEGRATEAQRERMHRGGMKAKYVSLRGSGSHLYLFPGLNFDRIEAFTEGSIGAIVAAQEGITVAAIKGIRCYRAPDGGPLPELAGSDFSGRIVPYLPDADDPPNPDVMEAAPRAARALSVPHGARPAIAYLPRGLDLDDYLLSLPDGKRRPAFDGVLRRASRLPAGGRHPPA